MIDKLVELFPEVKGQQFDDLVADIKKHGLLHPVVRFEGKVLDGRARVRACQIIGIPVHYIEYDSLNLNPAKISPDQYLWSVNAERRHLTADQRAVLGLAWTTAIADLAKARQIGALNKGDKPGEKSATPATSNPTRKEIAKRSFTTTHKVQQAEVVKKHAPKLLKKVASGKMKLKDAAKVAKRKVIQMRKPKVEHMPVPEAVRKAVNYLVADIKPLVENVTDKRHFYRALADAVGTYCMKQAKAVKVA